MHPKLACRVCEHLTGLRDRLCPGCATPFLQEPGSSRRIATQRRRRTVLHYFTVAGMALQTLLLLVACATSARYPETSATAFFGMVSAILLISFFGLLSRRPWAWWLGCSVLGPLSLFTLGRALETLEYVHRFPEPIPGTGIIPVLFGLFALFAVPLILLILDRPTYRRPEAGPALRRRPRRDV